jgi:hypothetical protein
MNIHTLRASSTGDREWFGYGDYVSVSPDGKTELHLLYVTEPPHGDSLHKMYLGSTQLKGLAWGSGVAWSPCSRYFTPDWTEGPGPSSRHVAVFDCWRFLRCIVSPRSSEYVRVSRLVFPAMYIGPDEDKSLVYTFGTTERWHAAA